MTDATFAEMVDRKAAAAGLNDYQLSAAIGLLSNNKVIAPKQVHRMRTGQQKTVSREVVQRLTEVLPFTEEEKDALWHAADLWPPDLSLDAYRKLRPPRRRRRSDREVKAPTANGEVAEAASDLDGPNIGSWSVSPREQVAA